jgi:hypothetical protein
MDEVVTRLTDPPTFLGSAMKRQDRSRLANIGAIRRRYCSADQMTGFDDPDGSNAACARMA